MICQHAMKDRYQRRGGANERRDDDFAMVIRAGSDPAFMLVAARVMVANFLHSPNLLFPCQFHISRFTAEDAKDLSALCSHISVALENIKRADEADEVSIHGVRNRCTTRSKRPEGLKYRTVLVHRFSCMVYQAGCSQMVYSPHRRTRFSPDPAVVTTAARPWTLKTGRTQHASLSAYPVTGIWHRECVHQSLV